MKCSTQRHGIGACNWGYLLVVQKSLLDLFRIHYGGYTCRWRNGITMRLSDRQRFRCITCADLTSHRVGTRLPSKRVIWMAARRENLEHFIVTLEDRIAIWTIHLLYWKWRTLTKWKDYLRDHRTIYTTVGIIVNCIHQVLSVIALSCIQFYPRQLELCERSGWRAKMDRRNRS